MQNLRDKLLKAGKVSKKQARQARTEKRKTRKKKGGARADEDAAKAQQERYEAEQARQAAAARERQAKENREREQAAIRHRARDLIRAHSIRLDKDGRRPFYFLGRDRRAKRFFPDAEVTHQLSEGALVIVEDRRDDGPEFALIDAAAAERLEALDADLILFWNRPGAHDPDGEPPAP